MYRLYALDKTNAAAAFSQIENGMLLDLAHDAMKNGSVMRAVYEQPALARQDGLWMLNNKRWGRIGGVNGHGYNLTIGRIFFPMNMDIMVCCLITAAILSAELLEAANMTVIHWVYMLEIKTNPEV